MSEAMKRLFCLATALLVVSCAREVIPEPSAQEGNQEVGTHTVSLTATFDPETRLSVNPTTGSMTWESTDKVAVFTQKGKLAQGDVKDLDGARATFSFTIDDDDAIEAGAIAYYPYSIAVEGHSDQIILPESFSDLNVANRSIPMKAVVTDGNALPFRHLASIVYVNAPTSTPSYPGDGNAPNSTPEYVLFSVGEGNSPITGKYTVGTDGTLTSAGDNGTMVRTPWKAGQPYLFVLPAATYAQGFSLSIVSETTQANGKDVYFTFYKKKRSSSYTAQRANLLNMPAFNPQCKEFYLTSTETDWSDNVTSARMIQTGRNSYLGALYSHRGPLGDRDLGFRILQGFNLGTNWINVIGGRNDNDVASYGPSVGNIYGDVGVWKVSITLYDNNWRYTTEWVGNEYNHQNPNNPEQGLSLVGFNDVWDSGIPLTQKVGHNWYVEVTVDNSSLIKPNTSYDWKIKRYDGWTVNWGRGNGQGSGTINSEQMSSFLQLEDSQHVKPGNCTLNLPAGTYDVYFNDATGWIQFIKK